MNRVFLKLVFPNVLYSGRHIISKSIMTFRVFSQNNTTNKHLLVTMFVRY